MRTGAEYRESLRDGRNVWVMGEGPIDDITTDPATCAMVEEYMKWYDRQFDPDCQDTLLSEPDANGGRRPLAFEAPKTSAHLQCLGKALRALLFTNGGNITHTPGYGALIALGLLNHLTGLNNSPEEIEAAEKYRESIVLSGRFLTFAGGRGTHRIPAQKGSRRACGAPPGGRDSQGHCIKRQGADAHQHTVCRGCVDHQPR